MKICKYCKTESNDPIVECKSCGSKEFDMKCNNCGEVFDSAYCPNCGVKASEKPKTCTDCSTKSFADYCPKCGNDLVNKQRKDDSPHIDTVIVSQAVPNPTGYEIKAMNNHKESKPNSGCLTIIKAFLIFLMIFFIVLIIMTPFIITSQHLPTANLDVITKEGHPKYLGSYKEATTFWKGYNNIQVNDPWKFVSFTDQLLDVRADNAQNDIINHISFDFSNMEDKSKLTLDEVLKIVSDYIPYDIIDEYYDYENSFIKVSKDGTEDYISYYYFMSLNEEGIKANSGLATQFAFRIQCYYKKNWYAEIDSDIPNLKNQSSPERYEVREWSIDLTKYR